MIGVAIAAGAGHAATLDVDVQTTTIQNALIHAGFDFSPEGVFVGTGSTVNYGSVGGDLWINNYQQISILDPDSVTTRESPSPCAESSAMQVDVNGTSTLFLFHSRTMQCSCEWSESAPCPAQLRVDTSGGGPSTSYFISVCIAYIFLLSTSLLGLMLK